MKAEFRAFVVRLLGEAKHDESKPELTGADLLGRFVDARRARKVEMNGPHSIAGAVGLCGEFACHERQTAYDAAILLVDAGASACPRCGLWHFPPEPLDVDRSVVRVCALCGGAR